MEDKLILKSLDVTLDKIEQLKKIMPEAFTEGKIDLQKFKQILGEQIETSHERYGLSWAGKNEAIKNIQTQSTGTLLPASKESVNFNSTSNMIIEGDNLEVLKLLQKSYYGKVKMIYIDPPYNTGKEFIYPDNYKEGLEDYLKYTGQINDEGVRQTTNSETSGRYHSKWMNMMYPRLFLARNLLKDNGVIFISIDDDEVLNLKGIMNEVFGEENFIANIVWQKKYSPQNDATYFSDMHDHILVYAKVAKRNKNDDFGWTRNLLPRTKEQEARYKNPDNDIRGPWKAGDMLVKTYSESYVYEIITPSGRKVNPPNGSCWRFSRAKFQEMVADNRIWFGNNGDNVPAIKRFLNEVQGGRVPTTWWARDEVGDNQEANTQLKNLFSTIPFDTPKPTRLIKRMLQLSTSPEEQDIILDFFAGSGTTAHAVMELNREDKGNRKFICVQLPEKCDEKSEAFKAGYRTIADITKERVRRVINKLKQEEQEGLQFDNELQLDLGFKVFKLDSSNFKVWDGSKVATQPDQIEEQLDLFVENVKDGRTELDILYEIMLKSGFSLTTNVEDIDLEAIKVYSVAEKSLFVCLIDKMNKKLIQAMVEQEPEQVICLDMAFHEQDELKTNTVLEMKSRNIKFRTV